MKRLFFFILPLIFNSCKTLKTTELFYVNSYRVDCMGVGPMKCLQVKNNIEDDWQAFYQEIEGFHYKPGYTYQIQVEKLVLPKEKIPADGSSLKYSLVKQISKTIDKSLRLNDFWVLTSVGNSPIQKIGLLMEIDIVKQQMTLTLFCNNLRAKLKTVTASEVQFSEMISTRKFCPEIKTDNLISSYLQEVTNYKIKNNTLILFNTNNDPVLTFKKID